MFVRRPGSVWELPSLYHTTRSYSQGEETYGLHHFYCRCAGRVWVFVSLSLGSAVALTPYFSSWWCWWSWWNLPEVGPSWQKCIARRGPLEVIVQPLALLVSLFLLAGLWCSEMLPWHDLLDFFTTLGWKLSETVDPAQRFSPVTCYSATVMPSHSFREGFKGLKMSMTRKSAAKSTCWSRTIQLCVYLASRIFSC